MEGYNQATWVGTGKEHRMDVSHQLVEYAANTRFTGFPPEVVEVAKRVILDMLGTSLAGSSAPGCAEVVDLLRGWGGRQESSILAFGGKVPCFQAAFANSMMAHARDFDDTYDEIPLHASASVLPAALAVAEARGAVTGKEVTEKFFKCSKYGSEKIPEKNLEQVVQAVGRLEKLEEVGVIPRLLSGQN